VYHADYRNDGHILHRLGWNESSLLLAITADGYHLCCIISRGCYGCTLPTGRYGVYVAPTYCWKIRKDNRNRLELPSRQSISGVDGDYLVFFSAAFLFWD